MNKLLHCLVSGLLMAALSLQGALAATDAKPEAEAAHAEEGLSHDHEGEEPHAEEKNPEHDSGLDGESHSGEGHARHESERAGKSEEHAGHADEKKGHDEHEGPSLIFSAERLKDFGGKIASAEAGVIRQQVSLPGEVRLNKEAVAHITPRFPAKIVKVSAKTGDRVKAGETLAVAESSETLARFELNSMIDGVVIQRQVTLGEHLSPDDAAFVVADLSTLWADIALYPKQVALVKVGQPIRITTSYGPAAVDTQIDYVAPQVEESTRTGLARVFLPNNNQDWKPGMFIEGEITLGEYPAAVVVPKTAVIDLDNQHTVFVQQGEGWDPRPVKLGRKDKNSVEILEGLEPGERYVAEGGFTLKAQLQKSEFESSHNH